MPTGAIPERNNLPDALVQDASNQSAGRVTQAHEREIQKLGLDHVVETERIRALHHTEVDALSRDYSELFVLCASPMRPRRRMPCVTSVCEPPRALP